MKLEFGKEYKVVDELYYCDTDDVATIVELRMNKDGFETQAGDDVGMLIIPEGTHLVYVGEDAYNLCPFFKIGQHIYEFPRGTSIMQSLAEV